MNLSSPQAPQLSIFYGKISNVAPPPPNVDLGVLGTAVIKISVRGATLDHEFWICKGVNDEGT